MLFVSKAGTKRFVTRLFLTTEAKVQQQRATDAATGFNLKCQELQERIEQERSSQVAALREQKEHYEQQKHSLQRLLAEAEEQLDRQRRELSAGFLLQAQQLEAKYAVSTADARAEAATAVALADARAAEAAAAHEQASQQMARAEVGCQASTTTMCSCRQASLTSSMVVMQKTVLHPWVLSKCMLHSRLMFVPGVSC